MALLTGFAIAIQGLPADHTYATSDDGFAWPCWGRSAGGSPVCAGNGSSARANCISQVNSQAGIIYGVTGVCHQTANRILSPAQAIVSGAKGYWASSFVYGTYGTDAAAWLLRRTRCAQVSGDRAGPPGAAGPTDDGGGPEPDPDEAGYIAEVQALYTEAPISLILDARFQGLLLARELGLTLVYRLGREDDGNVREPLTGIQRETLYRKGELDAQLHAQAMEGLTYAYRVNGLGDDMADQVLAVLGAERYQRLFGQEPGEPVVLVEPQIAAETYPVR